MVPAARPALAVGSTPKVAVIVLENKQYSAIVGSASAPYLNSLIAAGMVFTDYHAIQSGSAPNYRGMTAGTTAPVPPVPDNIFRAFDQASRPWIELEESMTGNCGVHDASKVPGTSQVLYIAGHDPAYVMRSNESCATHAVPLVSDAQLASLPEFSYIVPNACGDMHTLAKTAPCPSFFGPVAGGDLVQVGDNWLAHVVPLLLADPGMTVIITFDEGIDLTAQRIVTIEAGAGVVPGSDGQRYDHYGLLAGLYGFFGLGTAPNNGATATPLPIAPAATRAVDVDVQGPGTVTSDPAGIDCGPGPTGTCSASFAKGSSVTLTATPDADQEFDGWSGDCTGIGDCILSMDVARSVTAVFGTTATLTVDPPDHGVVGSDVGGIDCPAVCSRDYAVGTAVTLTSISDPGWTFGAWGGDCTGAPPSGCTLTIDADASVSVTYDPLPTYTLNVSTDGTGQGSVSSDLGAIDCPTACADDYVEGQTVVLSANPGPNSDLSAWTGACTGAGPSCSVTMNAAQSVNASFDAAPDLQTLDDDDPAIFYNGWRGVADASASGGAYRMSDVVGDQATWKSTKTASLTWVSHEGPAGGKATVTIDGKSKGTVDLYASSPARHSETFAGLTANVHTVIVKVIAGHNAASSGTEVGIDSFSSGGAVTPESSPSIKYDAWAGTASGHALGGAYRSSAAKSATATVRFTGTEIDWITSKGPAFGKASVSIDGAPIETVDLYRASQVWQSTIAYGGLAGGPHTMVIRVLGQKAGASNGTKVVVDGFKIHP